LRFANRVSGCLMRLSLGSLKIVLGDGALLLEIKAA